MGTVWRAQQMELGREVAIKRIAAATTPEVLMRFEREARTLANLNHPNIVRVLDYGEMDGAPFLAMELIEGQLLADLIGEPPIEPERAIALIAEIADALACLAEHGLVHRDVKPTNILVDAQGHAKLVDFGMIRDPGRTAVTEAGSVLGTLQYIPPEALRGIPPGPEADVWALGLIAFELMVGRPWNPVRSREALLRAIVYDPLPLETGRAPEWFDRLQARAIERDPAQRITAAEYRDALRSHKRKTKRTRRRARAVQPSRAFAFAALLAGVLGVVALAVLLLRPGHPRGPAASPAPPAAGQPIHEVMLNVTESEAYLWMLFARPERRTATLQSADAKVLDTIVSTDRLVRPRFLRLAPSTRYRVVITGEAGTPQAQIPFTTETVAFGKNAAIVAAQATDFVSLRFALEEGSNWPHPAIALAAARGFPLFKPDDEIVVMRAASLLDATGDPALAQALRTQVTVNPRAIADASVWRALARMGDGAALAKAQAGLAAPETAGPQEIRALTLLADAVSVGPSAQGCAAIAAAAEQFAESPHDFSRALVAADPDHALASASRWLAHPRFQDRPLRATAVGVLASLDRLDALPPGALDAVHIGPAGEALWRLAFVPAALPAIAAYRGPLRSQREWAYIVAAARLLTAAPELAARLTSPDPTLRRTALWALDALEPPPPASMSRELSAHVTRALSDPDPSVIEMAAWIVGRRRHTPLAKLLESRMPEASGIKNFGTGTLAWAASELGEAGRRAVFDTFDVQTLALGGPRLPLEQLAYAQARYSRSDAIDGLTPAARSFARAGISWHESTTTTATTFIVHSQAPFVRTGFPLRAAEAIEISCDQVRAPDATPLPSAAGGGDFAQGRRRLLFPFRDGELLLSAWQLTRDHPPRPPDAPPAALIRFTVRR